MLASLLLCLAFQAAPAQDTTIDADGVYVGGVLAPVSKAPRPQVTIELRGTSVVIADGDAVTLATIDGWKLAGPGGKGGDLVLGARGHFQGTLARTGAFRPAPRKAPAVSFKMRLWPERKAAMLCATDPMKKGAVIDRVPPLGTDVSPPGTTCWELALTWEPAPAPAPAPGPAPAPVPAPDFECMRECRQQNMMRAVSAEVIEADCRATCTTP